MHECIKFVKWIYGKKVYYACYALAIGYSRSRLINMIAKIIETTCYTFVHGNKHCQREKNIMTMVRVYLNSI